MSPTVAALGLAVLAAAAAPALSAEGYAPAALSFRPGSGSMILVLDGSRRPRLFDFADPAQPKLMTTLPDASTAAFLSADTIATGHEDGTIRRWHTDGTPAGAPLRASAKGVEAIVLSPTGRLVGTLDFEHALTLWTPALERRAGPLRKAETCEYEAEPHVWIVAFRAGDTMAAISTHCGHIAAWTAVGRPVAVPKPRDAPFIVSFAFASDGATLVAHYQAHPGAYNFVFPVDAARLGPARALPAPLDHAYAYAIAPLREGGFLFATGGGILRVNSKREGGAMIAFEGVYRVAVSTDGKRSAATDRTHLALWDDAGKLLGRVRIAPNQ